MKKLAFPILSLLFGGCTVVDSGPQSVSFTGKFFDYLPFIESFFFQLCALYRGFFFYCVHYREVISIVSFIERLFHCVLYREVISIVSIIERFSLHYFFY